jgi:RNA polymerase sigma-70 factor, ECF subfamily
MRSSRGPHASKDHALVTAVVRGTEDEVLLREIRRGDTEAVARLIRQLSPSMLGLARSFVRSGHAAEDVVQETWLAVLAGLERFEGRSSLRTWIFAILVNQARSYAVRDARTVPCDALDIDRSTGWSTLPPDSGGSDPERVALHREFTQLLVGALAQIPARQAITVILRDIDGVSATDTCQLMSISSTNQRVLLHRGRSVLRRPLHAYLSG